MRGEEGLVHICVMMWLIRCFLVLFVIRSAAAAGVDASLWRSEELRKVTAVMIPGFASTRLRSWSILDCPFSPLDFNPLDPVWLDIRKVLSVQQCWVKCVHLDPLNQNDHPECKSRPDSGVAAITELDPGYITGPLTSVWRAWVAWCVEFGVEPEAVVAAPYDWRLAGPVLEERDLYFHRLRLTFETCRKLRGGPALVFAHSLGNNVFRYFLEWLKQEIAPKHYITWLDDHIYTYHAIGAPYLGSPETLKAILSGATFGLPMSEGAARIMLGTFSAVPGMLPFSESSHTVDVSSHTKSNIDCIEKEYAPGWPVDILEVGMPVSPGDCSTSVPIEKDALTRAQKSYSADRISDGTIFQELAEVDPQAKTSLHQLQKYYINNSLFNPLTPWERPPIKNVYCMYGINLKTEVGYKFSPSGKPFPDNWILSDVIYENEGSVLQSRSGAEVNGNPGVVSGDATVPYYSLSWCKRWLGPRVNITRAPQAAHDGSDLQEYLNVEHDDGKDIVANFTRENRNKYITYYEDGAGLNGRKTAVWEFDKIDHRSLVQSPVLLRELLLENTHSLHSHATRNFVSKALRNPMRDEDCYWDYAKARCGLLEFCEYRYVFGDVHLGQSCRLRALTDKPILHYF